MWIRAAVTDSDNKANMEAYEQWSRRTVNICTNIPCSNTCYAMVVCRSHDTAGSLAHGVFISRPTGNPDPLAKSRPTGKIQARLLGHKVVHIVTRNIQKLMSCFHQYFIYIHKFNKPWHKKKTVWLTGA